MKTYPGNLTRTLFFLTALFGTGEITAQSYYPGGLGNSNLVLWLNAGKSSSVTKNGSNQVATWADLSGNSYSFTQSTTSNKPVYSATGGPNSRPALTFSSASSQYLSLSSLPSTSFAGGVSVFTQASFSASSSWGWQRIFDMGNGSGNNNIGFGRNGSTANFYYEGWNGGSGDQTYTTSNSIVNGASSIYEAVQQAGSAGTTTTVSHYLAGASQADNGAAGSSKTWIPNAVARSSNYIGRSNWAVDDYFSGTMSEILLYNSAFNTTQRVIMENYLSAEWGNTVSVSKYTPPSSTTYITNLVGIGYTSGTDYFAANPAGSTDGLGFSSTTTGGTAFLNTAGYLMAAHNGQSNTVITPATITNIHSASTISKWNRSWYLQKSGGNSSGQVTLNFNFTDYNGGTVSASNSYALLYNAMDGTFATGTNQLITLVGIPSVSIASNIVSFVVNVSNLANGYYTIVYSASTLPVSITGFAATKQDNSVLLNWSAAGETNIDHYEIQRGATTTGFVTVGSVAAKGTSAMSSKYGFTDNNPAAGMNYYRLKIVDMDGGSTYSTVVLVDIQETHSATPTLYPNPAVDQLHIAMTGATADASILILNTAGQTLKMVKTTGTGTVDIAIGDLNKGIYFVEIQTGGARYVNKVLKQ